jgi:hypothetical protein
MHSRITVSRFVGLVFLVAALATGTANAASSPEGYTTQGLKADGLRLQSMAERYGQMRGSTPAGLNADGLRLQAIAREFENRPAASFYTPQALKAEGLRWQRVAGTYARPQIVRNSGFDWGDAGIGAAGGLGFAMVGGALLIGARRFRHTKVAL